MDQLPFVVRRVVTLPALVSLWYLIRLWREGELFGVQEKVFCGWFILALAVQLLARTLGVWIAGVVAQVALSIVLVLKHQIDDIY